MNLPKDLGAKVIPKKILHWHHLKERLESSIEAAKLDIEINEEIIKVCKKKLKER